MALLRARCRPPLTHICAKNYARYDWSTAFKRSKRGPGCPQAWLKDRVMGPDEGTGTNKGTVAGQVLPLIYMALMALSLCPLQCWCSGEVSRWSCGWGAWGTTLGQWRREMAGTTSGTVDHGKTRWALKGDIEAANGGVLIGSEGMVLPGTGGQGRWQGHVRDTAFTLKPGGIAPNPPLMMGGCPQGQDQRNLHRCSRRR
jgi:hypothetical protein